MSASQMVSIAKGQIGVGESPPGSNSNKYTHWYGMTGSWCDMFVSWVANEAGELSAIGGKHAYCPSHVSWFKSHNQWGHTPVVGAIVFFDWNGNGQADHVGIVAEVRSHNVIVTVEGNSADKVRMVVRSSYILGYGYPKYKGGSGSGSSASAKRTLYLRKPLMSGSDVKEAQNVLKKKGFKISVDGFYGAKTRAAVVSFQRKNGLTADGVVGSKTWAKLK